jgi:hypothetical protein
MHVKGLGHIARGVGIGAAGLMIALGAVSFFLRPNEALRDQGASQAPGPAPTAPNILERAESPPANYLDLCRAAGL